VLNEIAAMPPEIPTCAETFRVLDEYVDRMAAGEPVETLMPAVKYHLDMCPACGEQFELLRDIIIEELRQ
jgi:hypothetical protein